MAWDPEGRNNNVKLYFRDVSRCKESGGRVLAGMSAGGGGWRWRLEVEAGGGGWRWRNGTTPRWNIRAGVLNVVRDSFAQKGPGTPAVRSPQIYEAQGCERSRIWPARLLTSPALIEGRTHVLPLFCPTVHARCASGSVVCCANPRPRPAAPIRPTHTHSVRVGLWAEPSAPPPPSSTAATESRPISRSGQGPRGGGWILRRALYVLKKETPRRRFPCPSHRFQIRTK
jgi:hypothetical protein